MKFPLFENDEQEGFKVTPLMIQKSKEIRERKQNERIKRSAESMRRVQKEQ